jgi:hypothetical protein
MISFWRSQRCGRVEPCSRLDRRSLKEKLANTGLVIASIIFCILTLEVGLRAYVGLRLYIEGLPYQYTYQFTNFRNHWIANIKGQEYPAALDPELGWVPKEGVWTDYKLATFTILDDGIRSNGSGELPDKTNPILAVGDSFTFGDQVSDWETWPAQLEKLSRREVINGGVSGYGIDQAFLRARRLLSRYRVSTVIFSFIPLDIQRGQLSENWSKHKPYFDFKDGRLTLENVPVSPPALPSKEGELLIAIEHSQLAHSVMKRWAFDWWSRYHYTQVQNDQKGREVACALLHKLEGLTKSHGAQLIVLVQHLDGEGAAESKAVESVLRCLSDRATRVLDLEPALSELKAKDTSSYNRLFAGHMTAEGNQFVALELSKYLTQAHSGR